MSFSIRKIGRLFGRSGRSGERDDPVSTTGPGVAPQRNDTVAEARHRAAFLATIPTDEDILEIGPFFRPSLVGAHVRYFDVLDKQHLIQRANQLEHDPEHIPEIDYVSATGDLGVVAERFANAFSSHCIEHQPDLVRHLQGVSRLLKDGGRYFLIIPDCRYCFDHFIPPSTIASVIDAHRAGHALHRDQSVIEHMALTTHNDPVRHWAGDHGNPETAHQRAERIRRALVEIEGAAGKYIDVHAWQFTPGSFGAIIDVLHELGWTRLRVGRVHDTPHNTFEFCVELINADSGNAPGGDPAAAPGAPAHEGRAP